MLDDDAIITALNRSKLRTNDGATWTARAVAAFREQHGIPAFSSCAKAQNGWTTQAEAATCLGVSPMSMTRLVQIGIIPAEQPHHGLPTVIKQSELGHER